MPQHVDVSKLKAKARDAGKESWLYLDEEERWDRFDVLNLPDEVDLLNARAGGHRMELSVPIKLRNSVLDKLAESGYVTFSIDLFHDSGRAAIGAWMLRDHEK